MSNTPAITIRPERSADVPAIDALLRAAFPAPLEAQLVAALRDAGDLTLSLVVTLDDQLVAHIAFSPITIDSRPTAGLGLAPVAVHPDHQNQAIKAGKPEMAMSHFDYAGLDACARRHVTLVVVLGEPGYYHRFVFQTASAFGLTNEYGVDEPFMVRWIQTPADAAAPGRADHKDAPARPAGLVRYAPAFSLFAEPGDASP